MELNSPGLLCILPTERIGSLSETKTNIEQSISIHSGELNQLFQNHSKYEGCKLYKEKKSPQEVDEDNVITFQHELEKEPEDEDKNQGIECEERPNIENKFKIDPDYKTKIGSGAFGEVFLVRSLPGLKKVALKEILVPEKLSLITNEIALHKNLNHINIVKFLKFEIKTECQKKKCYIYLEYIPASLTNFLSQQSYRRYESYVLFFLRQLIDGVVYLHSQEIVHCDIKCDNILVDDNETLKICDFGFAHDLRNGKVMSFRGTPNFAAPEVCNPPAKKGFGKPADIWSIGCTCLEMLTGNAPFHQLESFTIIFQMAYGTLKIEDHLQNGFSDGCKDLLLSCWTREAFKRPTIEQLSEFPFLNSGNIPLEASDEDSTFDEEELEPEEEDDNEETDLDIDCLQILYEPKNNVALQRTCVAAEMHSTFVGYTCSINNEDDLEREDDDKVTFVNN